MDELTLALIVDITDHIQAGTFREWADGLSNEKLAQVIEIFNFVITSGLDGPLDEGELDLTEANKEIVRIQRISLTGPLK